jgi:hypothetical protein
MEGLSRAVITGIFSPDEAREKEDLAAVEGGHGRMPRVQQQVVPLSYGTDLKPPDPAKALPPPPAADPAGEGDGTGDGADTPDGNADDTSGRSFDDFGKQIDELTAKHAQSLH